jgi:hypothetical protein
MVWTGGMDLDRGAGLLHRLTSYSPDHDWDIPVDDPRLRRDLVPNDLATRPPAMKSYPNDRPAVDLPRDYADPATTATHALAGRPAPPLSLDPTGLGRVPFLGAGVVRTAERDGARHLFRASGSAGARFPPEVYVSTRGVAGVPDGVHWYDGARHRLVQVWPAAAGDVTTLVVTGVPWRTAWRYAERGWRHLYWDAGTLLAQLSATADCTGLGPRLRVGAGHVGHAREAAQLAGPGADVGEDQRLDDRTGRALRGTERSPQLRGVAALRVGVGRAGRGLLAGRSGRGRCRRGGGGGDGGGWRGRGRNRCQRPRVRAAGGQCAQQPSTVATSRPPRRLMIIGIPRSCRCFPTTRDVGDASRCHSSGFAGGGRAEEMAIVQTA